jgi:hypothetical protein
MSKPANVTKSTGTSAVSPKKTLEKLFEDRDRTHPGSREEERAAEKILEAVFPDTKAD